MKHLHSVDKLAVHHNLIKSHPFSSSSPQVELMDLLGEEGIQNLPLLERLQHLDGSAEEAERACQ